MPFYDYLCYPCEGVIAKRRPSAQRDDPVGCPDCGAPMARAMGSMTMIGAGFDKKIRFGDHVFDTNAAEREWRAKNPDAEVVSRDSLAGKQTLWEAHQEADVWARGMGYNSEEHLRACNRAQSARRREMRGGVGGVQKYFGANAGKLKGKA